MLKSRGRRAPTAASARVCAARVGLPLASGRLMNLWARSRARFRFTAGFKASGYKLDLQRRQQLCRPNRRSLVPRAPPPGCAYIYGGRRRPRPALSWAGRASTLLDPALLLFIDCMLSAKSCPGPMQRCSSFTQQLREIREREIGGDLGAGIIFRTTAAELV